VLIPILLFLHLPPFAPPETEMNKRDIMNKEEKCNCEYGKSQKK
jgi:hypothetical protein